MVRISKKKKGRPPKPADLVDRRPGQHHQPRTQREVEIRRSTRRRSTTYVEDFYDDIFDDEEIEEAADDDDDEVEDERRREKKLNLVLKGSQNKQPSCNRVERVNSVSRNGGNRGGRSVGHVSAPESSSSSEYEEDNKPFKKRKIGGGDDDDFSEQNEEEDEDEDVDHDEDEDVRSVRSRDQQTKKKILKPNGFPKKMESIQPQVPQGKLSDSSKGVALPDRQQLGLILDKLQKKDTYGVYAEPVDPEELPDYHDVIEHPMDFGTVRKKLANGVYSKLEQFENDVGLICTNAMHYNAPETIYFKQARSIQEIARKKFERLRIELKSTVVEVKSEEPIKSSSIVTKEIKKSVCKTIQEPAGSDFSPGATVATAGGIRTLSDVTQVGVHEKPTTVDAKVDVNSSLTENKPEKAEEQLPGKGFPSKLGRKPFAVDENRRATYNISNQPVVRSESMCTIFEGEHTQLVSVGLHADHSYARSLSRFAATLGPVAWKVASQRIEQTLPSGIKFGRGWVGEYEPLPTPVVMFQRHTLKQPSSELPSKPTKDTKTVARARKDDKTVVGMKVGEREALPNPVRLIENQMQWQPGKCSQGGKVESRNDKFAEGSKVSKNDNEIGLRTKNSSVVTPSCKLQDHAKERHFTNSTSEGKSGFFGVSGSKSVANATYQQQNLSSMNGGRSGNMVSKHGESHPSPSACGNPNRITPQKQLEANLEMTNSRLMEVVPRNRNLVQSVPFKQSESDGVAAGRQPNGKVGNHSNSHQPSSLPYAVGPNQQARAAMYFPHGNNEQGLSDPVQMMRMLAEKNQNQQQRPLTSAPTMGAQSTSSDPSSRRDDSNGAATAAARAWMTLGAGHFRSPDSSPKMQIAATSLYNSSREVPQSVLQNREESPVPRVQFHRENTKMPPQLFLHQPTRAGDESRFLNNGQMVFPQLVTADLSRFQMQSPWQGLVPHTQPNKKQGILPPDLNISFPSPGSPPVKQSSGAMVDSQQPDLALQL